MERITEGRANRRKGASISESNGLVKDHRVETPRFDNPKERTSSVVAQVAKAMAKPGLTRAQIFQGTSRKVYAYSLYSKDPSKFVREDASGHKILGRFIRGRFRPVSSGPQL
jgi:hypothetical protein